MLLAIDRGNTRDKFAVFDGDKIITAGNDIFSENDLLKTLKDFAVTECIFSSVKDESSNLRFKEVVGNYCTLKQITADMSLPFINKYKSSGLGIDRLCVIAGAEKIYGKNVLVIDAGTCITFDYLNLDNEYCGGSISPGFQIKYKALHNFTANLPLINKLELVDVCSDNTKQCIESGVINGTLAEVEGMIGFYRRNYKDVLVVITGGDGEFIHDNTKEDTVLNENLVFIGLKNIFESNG